MMTPPGTFDRVYAALKERLRAGTYRPGARLEPAALAEELNASVTPVRDALHRLTGERLVDAPRHEGFRVPMMTETMLRQLYQWHRDLLLLAVAAHGGPTVPDGIGEELDALFVLIAEASRNAEHVGAFQSAASRLQPAQRVEALFLDGVKEETAAILDALRAQDRPRLRRALILYHRRRERVVPEVVAELLHG